MSFKQKLVIAFGTALVILLWIGVLTFRRTLQEDEDQKWVSHTHLVTEKLDAALADLVDAETNQRGYLITGEDSYLNPYRSAANAVYEDAHTLRKLTADNPTQQRSLDEIEPLIALKLAELDDRIKIRNMPGLGAVIPTAIDAGTRYMEHLRTLISKMRLEEQRLLSQRMEAAQVSSRNMKKVLILGNILALVFLMSAGLVIREEMDKRKRSEETLRLSEDDLEAANKELEAFCYSVSHDLRTPLRGIDGFSQALLEDYENQLDSQGKEYLQRVRMNAQRMATLIDDLLNLSRITRSEMRRETVDLSLMAESVAIDLRNQEPERRVVFAVAPGLRTEADPRLLRIVLENLLGNSWKFTSKREGAEIQVGRIQDNGRSAYFVRDNGAGFDPKYSSKLFGAFQRLHGITEFPGTGIGLATVQRIIHRHGGRVWADAELNRGATFYFTLQLSISDEEESNEGQSHFAGRRQS